MIIQIMSHADLKIFMHLSLIIFMAVYVLALFLVFHPKREKIYRELAQKVIQDEQQ